MKTINLGLGQSALVDDEDYDFVSGHKWYASGTGYAMRITPRPNRRGVLMHRVLMGLEAGDRMKVDHRNGNGFDNRRANLRLATTGENAGNQRSHQTRRGVATTSRFKGVCKVWHRWQATIGHQGRTIYLGLHATEEAAARAYDKAALELFGPFARVNLP